MGRNCFSAFRPQSESNCGGRLFAGAWQSIFSGPVNVFHDRRLPEMVTPAGYAALIHAYDLPVPVPRVLCAIGKRHRTTKEKGWRIFTPRHAPEGTLEGHVTFALKYEGLDLAWCTMFSLGVGSTLMAFSFRCRRRYWTK
jgi:hypothetical protein